MLLLNQKTCSRFFHGDACRCFAMRMMSSLGRLDQHRLRTGKLDDNDWPRVTSALHMLSEAPLFIDDHQH